MICTTFSATYAQRRSEKIKYKTGGNSDENPRGRGEFPRTIRTSIQISKIRGGREREGSPYAKKLPTIAVSFDPFCPYAHASESVDEWINFAPLFRAWEYRISQLVWHFHATTTLWPGQHRGDVVGVADSISAHVVDKTLGIQPRKNPFPAFCFTRETESYLRRYKSACYALCMLCTVAATDWSMRLDLVDHV